MRRVQITVWEIPHDEAWSPLFALAHGARQDVFH